MVPLRARPSATASTSRRWSWAVPLRRRQANNFGSRRYQAVGPDEDGQGGNQQSGQRGCADHFRPLGFAWTANLNRTRLVPWILVGKMGGILVDVHQLNSEMDALGGAVRGPRRCGYPSRGGPAFAVENSRVRWSALVKTQLRIISFSAGFSYRSKGIHAHRSVLGVETIAEHPFATTPGS